MQTIYNLVGEEKIRGIARVFYEEIAKDELLRAMYPKDLAPAEERFALFLVQVFGGPTTYSDQRGHPRLRKRHFPYKVDMTAREHWMKHINTAMDTIGIEPEVRTHLDNYFSNAATHMMNQ